MPGELRRALGIRTRHPGSPDLEALSPPDSAVCRAAEELVATRTSEPVANHSYRTYSWAAALAAHDRLEYDRELVYVASLVHDLYFERPHALPHPHCLTLPAANEAERLGREAGWEPARARAAAEAITLHANMSPPRDSPELYLVFAGARLDTGGYRLHQLHDEIVREVLARHPRAGMKEAWARIFEAQAHGNPGSRVDFMKRYLAAGFFVQRAPFDD